ncbi:MAG: hypothetical protein MUD17_04120 [Gemmatimonadaceae bacterium]|jgi:hypothetical protein|nr:hypothetical protein [Gemmatimonadaceae bacterium]
MDCGAFFAGAFVGDADVAADFFVEVLVVATFLAGAFFAADLRAGVMQEKRMEPKERSQDRFPRQ